MISLLSTKPTGGSRLLCFHQVGGDRNSFQLISKHMAGHKKCDVYAVYYPGRIKADSSSLLTNLNEIVELVYGNMMAMGGNDFWGARPLSFFGHSLGGMVAFEVARRLQVRNPCIQLTHLVVSSIKSPASLTLANAAMTANQTAHHSKSDEALIRHIKSIGGLPPGLSDAFVKLKLPVIRSDFAAFETYSFGDNGVLPTRLTCDITAFGGTKDIVVSEPDMLGWMLHTSGTFKHVPFQNGSHFYFTEESCKREFLDGLNVLPL